MPTNLLHRDLSYQIVGCAFDVHNEVGPGLREECYQKAMEHRLFQKGVRYVAKPATRRELVFRNQVVDVFEPDLVIADRIVVELKHHVDGFAPQKFSQIIAYLKILGLDLGLLVNFALDSCVYERIPFLTPPQSIDEDYNQISGIQVDAIVAVTNLICEGLRRIYDEVGLGYTATTYRRVAEVEFEAMELWCDPDPLVEPVFLDRLLPQSRISPIIINKLVCVQIEAISDDVSARAIRTMQTHLRLTGCKVGLVATFGKTRVCIRGVRP